MSVIKILPRDLQNRIAAGEVVERPASVVKELLENALDAKATDIRVDILQGGKRLIRVIDNGIGMDREDALLCFHPHATSKLQNPEDLFRIETLGFRGEALSSIASVSRMRVLTSTEDSPLGVSVDIEGGQMKDVREIAHRGTTIEVNSLFYNTPARKKFLKSTKTEVYHIVGTVTEIALCYPEVAFNLTIDRIDTLALTIASGIKERLLQVYGEEFLQGLIDVSEHNLRALTSREDNFRSSRANQFIFVNRRPVRDTSLRHAIYRAYDTILPRDRHPLFFLFLELYPSEVDFNVHPTKREVRFTNKEIIYRSVHDAIRSSLRKTIDRESRQIDESPLIKNDPTSYEKQNASATKLDFVHGYSRPFGIPEVPLVSEPSTSYGRMFDVIYLGDVFLAFTDGSGITLLDHHAAHERVLYERLQKGVDLQVTQMLFPRQVKLPSGEYEIVITHRNELENMGIETEDFGHNTLLIRAIPHFLSKADIAGIVSDIAHFLVEIGSRSPVDELKDEIAKKIACHSSVRGALSLTGEEVNQLLMDLSQTEDPEHCPHGRPTRLHFSIENLKHMFKRTG
jgi:DNA mismatch repair protein MutL